MWKEARDVDVDNDNAADTNLAATALDTENRSPVQVIRGKIGLIHAYLVLRRPGVVLRDHELRE